VGSSRESSGVGGRGRLDREAGEMEEGTTATGAIITTEVAGDSTAGSREGVRGKALD